MNKNAEELIPKINRLNDQGRTREAVELLAAWLKSNPNDEKALIEYVLLEYEEMEIDDWLKLLDSEILQNSTDSEVHRKLAFAYYLVGADQDAAYHYRMSLRLDPKNWESMQGLALLFSMGHISANEAELLLRNALRIAPKEWQVAYNLASVLVHQNKIDGARKMLILARILAPESEKKNIERRISSLG